MQKFIGTKLIEAVVMTRLEYNEYRGWELPADEDGNDPGMLVEYIDGGAGNHPNHVGYISWSPLEVFDKAYRPVKGLPFSLAIEAALKGKRIARQGWNGKGMFVYAVPPNSYEAQTEAGHSIAENGMVNCGGYMAMKPAYGPIVVGWLASQSDMFADDWEILD